jgi:hypothetical protein
MLSGELETALYGVEAFPRFVGAGFGQKGIKKSSHSLPCLRRSMTAAVLSPRESIMKVMPLINNGKTGGTIISLLKNSKSFSLIR